MSNQTFASEAMFYSGREKTIIVVDVVYIVIVIPIILYDEGTTHKSASSTMLSS
jgi:hypothetical protein